MGEIEFLRVTRRHDNGHEALRDVSLRFPAGSMTFLTGHSGAGKSTLLRLLLGIDRPTRGQIRVNGVNVAALGARQRAFYRRHLGVVLQDPHLLPDRSVVDNVLLPLRICGESPRDAARRARAALGLVGLQDREHSLPKELSTGEQQRVGIARAVATRPAVLLADEPTGNLDPTLSREVMEVFRQFHALGTTVIVASHDLELIDSLGERVVELSAGMVVLDSDEASFDDAGGRSGS
ncbi:MAG: cell division ATP-binding protein FtsE [Pseudomonadales bacterium]